MFTIRRARVQDADALARIASDAYARYVSVIGRRPAPMDADYTRHCREDTVFVLENAQTSEVAGFAVVKSDADGFCLDTIAIAGAHRGNGYGTALLDAVEAHVSRHTDRYSLYTHVAMTRNINWYLRLGFVETHRETVDGYDRVFFEKRCVP